MATFIIRIKLLNAGANDYATLKNAMENENFLQRPGEEAAEPSFNYYGNQSLLEVNNAVKRAAMCTGRLFSFTAIKDKEAETQQHRRQALVTLQRTGGISLFNRKGQKNKPGMLK